MIRSGSTKESSQGTPGLQHYAEGSCWIPKIFRVKFGDIKNRLIFIAHYCATLTSTSCDSSGRKHKYKLRIFKKYY